MGVLVLLEGYVTLRIGSIYIVETDKINRWTFIVTLHLKSVYISISPICSEIRVLKASVISD